MKYLFGESLMSPLYRKQGHRAGSRACVSWEGTDVPVTHGPPSGEEAAAEGSGRFVLQHPALGCVRAQTPSPGRSSLPGASCPGCPACWAPWIPGEDQHPLPGACVAQSGQRGPVPAPSGLAAATDQEVGAVPPTLQGLSGAGEVWRQQTLVLAKWETQVQNWGKDLVRM